MDGKRIRYSFVYQRREWWTNVGRKRERDREEIAMDAHWSWKMHQFTRKMNKHCHNVCVCASSTHPIYAVISFMKLNNHTHKRLGRKFATEIYFSISSYQFHSRVVAMLNYAHNSLQSHNFALIHEWRLIVRRWINWCKLNCELVDFVYYSRTLIIIISKTSWRASVFPACWNIFTALLFSWFVYKFFSWRNSYDDETHTKCRI